ncbi:MAG: hypothetical protein R2697_14795 [Ilumatobacteraceae bacterium]
MSEPLKRTWPQRLTFAFVLVVAFACFATAGALAAGQWVLSQRNLVVLDQTAEAFVPSASDTPVVMPGDTTTTTESGGETTTTVTCGPSRRTPPTSARHRGRQRRLQRSDRRHDRRPLDIGERSGTIMIWRVNPVANQLATVLSFPRPARRSAERSQGSHQQAYRRNDRRS